MAELGLRVEEAVRRGIEQTAPAVAEWANCAPAGWALAYIGSTVWADRGCRLLDIRLPRHAWLPDVAAALDPSACVVLSALLDAAACGSEAMTSLLVARCDGAALTAAALSSPAAGSPVGERALMGWDDVRPAFACAAEVMRRLCKEHGSTGEAFCSVLDLPPRG